MEEHEPTSLVGTTMRRIQRALTRSADFMLGLGQTALEFAFFWRT
jgi:hypothetical protein